MLIFYLLKHLKMSLKQKKKSLTYIYKKMFH